MASFVWGLIKIAIFSLAVGAGLSALDLSAADILLQLGMTPESVMALLDQGARWALPNLILGSMVIVPIWLVVMLLRPPRS
ncbi:MAG: DUF6460 domain-containing protein [Mesorhizobium sp.]